MVITGVHCTIKYICKNHDINKLGHLGVIQSFQEGFQGLHCTGSFFHLCQCVWRRIQANGLQQDYQTDPDDLASWLRSLPALAFLLPLDIEQAFDDLVSADGFYLRAQEIANYFEDIYIGCPNRPDIVSHNCSH